MPKRRRHPDQSIQQWDDFESESYQEGQTLPGVWSAEDSARWLFDFLRTDLRVVTAGQLLGMRADMWAFVAPEIVDDRSWDKPGPPPVEILESLQRDARAGLQRVRHEGKSFELEKGIGYGIARHGDRIIRVNRRGTFEDLFRATVMDIVQIFWKQLHECPHCGSLFLKIGKQKYCSLICARRTHWAAFQERRAPRDHHREHVRRVRRRLGANVTVGTKPRRKK